MYDGPPHGGEIKIASAYISKGLSCTYMMDLLEEITSDEFYFIQDTIYLCIMLCTGDFDGVHIYSDDLVEILRKLNGVTSDLHQSRQQKTYTPQKASTMVSP